MMQYIIHQLYSFKGNRNRYQKVEGYDKNIKKRSLSSCFNEKSFIYALNYLRK